MSTGSSVSQPLISMSTVQSTSWFINEATITKRGCCGPFLLHVAASFPAVLTLICCLAATSPLLPRLINSSLSHCGRPFSSSASSRALGPKNKVHFWTIISLELRSLCGNVPHSFARHFHSVNRLRNVHTFCSRAAILDAAVKPIGENSLETYLHVLCLDSHIFHCTKEKNSKRQRKRWPPPCKNHVCTKPIFAVPAVCQRLDGQGSPTKMADRLFLECTASLSRGKEGQVK